MACQICKVVVSVLSQLTRCINCQIYGKLFWIDPLNPKNKNVQCMLTTMHFLW